MLSKLKIFHYLLLLVFLGLTFNAIAISRASSNPTPSPNDQTFILPTGVPWHQAVDLNRFATDIGVDSSRLSWKKIVDKNKTTWFVALDYKIGFPAHVTWEILTRYGIKAVTYWNGRITVKATADSNILLPYELGNGSFFH